MVEPSCAGSLEALAAGLADRFSLLVVFVVGGDVADRFVAPDFVAVDADACGLCVGQRRVGDVVEVGPFVVMWPKKLSIQAWSVGVRGRRGCWAMAIIAM